MRGVRLVPVLVVAALAGCSSAATARTAPATRAVHLVAYSPDDGPTSTVILTGGIGDHGTATSVHPDGTVDPDHGSLLRLDLGRGTFRLDIAALDQQLVKDFAGFPADTATCSGEVTASAAAPVVAGSGTGAYAGVRGSFRLTVTIDEVLPTAGGCTGTAAPVAQSVVIAGSGDLTR